MNMTAVLIIIGAALLSVVSARPAMMADQYARGVDWLIRYGYLPFPDSLIGRLQTREGIEEAVRKMQRFAGIEETGELDRITLEMMARPRCSLPDTISSEDLSKGKRRGKGKMKKRYTTRLSWEKTDITWSVQDFPSPSMSPTLHPGLVRLILTYALRAWSDVTNLRFHGTRPSPYDPSPQTDIKVTFASGYHEDGYPFDGKGGTLAHAFFPGKEDLAGDTHFDDGESWSNGDRSSNTDLFTVAVHEFGHALGLFHSSSNESIMKPYYYGPVGDMHSYSLPLDDRLRIQALYGKRPDLKPSPSVAAPTTNLPRFSTPAPPHHPPASSDRCQGGYDAIANIRAEVFFFRGPHFWRVHHSGSLMSSTPAVIHSFWIGLPPETTRVDAVYERRDGYIVFFIGNQYWVFRNTVSLSGYPRPLSEWGLRSSAGRIPERVEAVFVWPHNGRTYLFSGGEYWRFDEVGTERKLQEGYPKPASIWGMPSHPDDIIGFLDGDTYFFKDSNYWILKRGGLDQESAFPKSIATDWMKCDGNISTHRPEIPRRDKDCGCVQSTAAEICALSAVMYSIIVLCILVLMLY